MEKTITFGKTFATDFAEWETQMKEGAGGALADTTLVRAFADYLDRSRYLTPQLELLGLMKAREIDAMLITALIAEVGEEKATELARQIKTKVEARA